MTYISQFSGFALYYNDYLMFGIMVQYDWTFDLKIKIDHYISRFSDFALCLED